MGKTKIYAKKTGAFALLDNLVRNGTHYIFGYPGGAILPIYDELYFWEKRNTIKHILTRHEQGAIHAADSFARVSGQTGVCFATSGPGATNLITGIANAQIDSIPIIVITGQVTKNLIGTDAFQETDIFGITFPIIKHSYKLEKADELCTVISEAFYIAQNGRPGPVLIDIPKNLGSEIIRYYHIIRQKNVLKLQGYRFRYYLNRKTVENIIESLKTASRPLVYVGGGAILSNVHKELLELSQLFRLPITTTLMGKGCFNEKQPLALGMLGMHGTAAANFAVSECDLLFAIGARFDDRVTGKLDSFACLAKIIHIDIDPAEIGKNKIADIYIIGDLKQIFQELLSIYKCDKNVYTTSHNKQVWLNCIEIWKMIYPLIVPKLHTKLSPQYVINKIGSIYSNAIFTTDVGQHQMWSAQFLPCGPRRWSSSAGLGTMGYGLPAAIGAQFAFPDEFIICITGDSSIQMCIQELGTIAQYKLPIRIIIINNHYQGMVRQWQESFYENRFSHSRMDEGQPNFITLANSYGIKGVRVESELELEKELYQQKNYTNPILFDCLVIENENCYPMVSPGQANVAMEGIIYQDHELAILKRYLDEEDPVVKKIEELKNIL